MFKNRADKACVGCECYGLLEGDGFDENGDYVPHMMYQVCHSESHCGKHKIKATAPKKAIKSVHRYVCELDTRIPMRDRLCEGSESVYFDFELDEKREAGKKYAIKIDGCSYVVLELDEELVGQYSIKVAHELFKDNDNFCDITELEIRNEYRFRDCLRVSGRGTNVVSEIATYEI